jgi:DNA mismatch repair ATPase MutS
MYWLAHLGMGIPADKAQLSAIDAIFTSFNTEDNIDEGTGLYLTELKRISQFSRPASGQPKMTPYSIVFFDEFANGTDHEESVKRTKIVLDYLSRKGVTAYFTTHKHEIADMVDAGDLPGAVNLGAEVRQDGNSINTTYRILRSAKEKSYGHVQAEAMGITTESLQMYLLEEIARNIYPVEDTRVATSGKPVNH